jgi:hypothetical protein
MCETRSFLTGHNDQHAMYFVNGLQNQRLCVVMVCRLNVPSSLCVLKCCLSGVCSCASLSGLYSKCVS